MLRIEYKDMVGGIITKVDNNILPPYSLIIGSTWNDGYIIDGTTLYIDMDRNSKSITYRIMVGDILKHLIK